MSPRWRFVVITLAALATALLTARLGVWQLDRAAEKNARQAAVERQAELPALDGLPEWPADAAQASGPHHRRVELKGQWVPERTVYLDNRQMGGRPGFYVVTPLRLPDGRAVLVQRGWLARDPQDRARVRDLPTPSGDVAVNGRIAPPPARLFEFEGSEAGRIRQNLDLGDFARETGLRLAPWSVVQTEPAPADGLQRDWPAPATGVDKHYGYAFQWFGLSALVVILYVWFQFVQPRRRKR